MAEEMEALFLMFKSLSLQQLIDMGFSVNLANKLIGDFSVLSKVHENECKNGANKLTKAFIELTWES